MAPFQPRASLRRKAHSMMDLSNQQDAADLRVTDWAEPSLRLGRIGSVRFNSEQQILQLESDEPGQGSTLASITTGTATIGTSKGGSRLSELKEKNKSLKEEHDLLTWKVNILTDMLVESFAELSILKNEISLKQGSF